MRYAALTLLALAFALAAGSGLTGENLPAGHDTRCHALSTIEYARCFEQGVAWPRWLPDFSAGYGGADPLYYSPLVFQFAGRLHQAGASVATALKVTALLGLALSALGMFLWGESVWGPAGGLLATVLYVFAPYHLCDLYIRFSLPEFVGMGIAPWIFVFVRWHVDGRPGAWRWLALTLGVLIGVHPLSIVLFGGLVAAYAGCLLAQRGSLEPARGLVTAALAGAGISAVVWVPVIVDGPGLWMSHNGFADMWWHRHFLSLGQLADSHWPGVQTQMPLYLGRPILALAAAALVVATVLYAMRTPGILSWWAFAAAVTAHLALALDPARVLWAHSPLPTLEFPWRFLAPASLGLAILSPLALRPLAERPAAALGAHLLVCAGLVAWGLGMCNGKEPAASWPSRDDLARAPITATHYPMYLPVAGRPTLFPGSPRFEIAAGDGTVTVLETGSQSHRLRVEARTPVTLEIRIFLFDGWYAQVDGQPAELHREDQYGGMRLKLEPGTHDVLLAFGWTPLRALGLALSLAAALALVLVAPTPVTPGLRARLAGGASRLALTLGVLCALAVVHRRTPLSPAYYAAKAQAFLDAQQIPEALPLLALVPPGTSRYSWAQDQLDLLEHNGVTLAIFPGGDVKAAPFEQVRRDLALDPSLSWSLPVAPPLAFTATARLTVPAAGVYEFGLDGAGTAALAIDGAPVAGGPVEHPVAHVTGDVRLTRGDHDLVLFYRSRGAEAVLRVTWRPPGEAAGLIPLAALKPAPALRTAAVPGLPALSGIARR